MTTDILIAVLAGLTAGVFSALITARKLHAENVTTERQKWREKLRETALSLVEDEIQDTHWIDLQTRLNPFSAEAATIIDSIKNSRGKKLDSEARDQSIRYISLLLKHDWERSKIESSFFTLFASKRAWRRIKGLNKRGTRKFLALTTGFRPSSQKD
ncbi:hypothetical protein ACFCW2_00670 [Qipengyuania sp. DSG2-2]|uniref:hypothetical protein n=1 Tax=Qipengyuania sp. DGS2-2 TaxID=3349631 RepID=UPI0036D3BBF4